MDKCGGILAAVGDVKTACPWLLSSGVYGTMDGALFVIILFSAVSFFLFHTLWPFVFPFLSFSLICLFCMLY